MPSRTRHEQQEPQRQRSRSRSPLPEHDHLLVVQHVEPRAQVVEVPPRVRGGYRPRPTAELTTIPANLAGRALCAGDNTPGTRIEAVTNYVKVEPMQESKLYSYRVTFEPDIESVSLRRFIFRRNMSYKFGDDTIYDGVTDARSHSKLEVPQVEFEFANPKDHTILHKITVKLTGEIQWDSFEMLRTYNMHVKSSLIAMGFFQASKTGSYVHPKLATQIGDGKYLMTLRGYKTGVNCHDGDNLLCRLEPAHKLVQKLNVLETMSIARDEAMAARQSPREAALQLLTGKLVVATHNNKVYRIEDINFDMTPLSTFHVRKTNQDIAYVDYFKTKYNLAIKNLDQPMLLVVDNNKRREQESKSNDCYMIPELCNIAGLTDKQRNDNKLKMDLIRSSQIAPADRVRHMVEFLKAYHESVNVNQMLKKWKYSLAKEPVAMTGVVLPTESVGSGAKAKLQPNQWAAADRLTGAFETIITRDSLAESPEISRLAIIISRPDLRNLEQITGNLRRGCERIKFKIKGVPLLVKITDGDGAHLFRQRINQLPAECQAAIVILPNTNKDRYDAVKKCASCDKGLVTQAVTSRLMMDERKASSAAIKIGIQLAAKCGGEPWYVYMPITGDMVCGYDTYHDNANRGRSFGAFVASTNEKFSKWFSRADCHDHLDELSTHLSDNLLEAVKRFTQVNGKPPRRVWIYRDGVGDGQLAHVFENELKRVLSAVRSVSREIMLTFTIVNKQVGARFYMKQGRNYANPPPGSVFDNTVTRRERFDFYLVSQSTRNGTVSPTYYNIIYDESGLDPSKHQMLAYKLCFLYYNWTGTVRVPAPCQYAHKLAQLCGEHLHTVPHEILGDRLHFL